MFAFSFLPETPFNAGFIRFPDLLGSDGVYLNYPLTFFNTSVDQGVVALLSTAHLTEGLTANLTYMQNQKQKPCLFKYL